jgi:galactose mutarotase-like enzyme
MITIKNNSIVCEINEKGAEIRSIKYNGNDQMWKGIPEIWGGVAPLLFPICGGLKDDKFIYDGKEYTLQKHGYIRFETFQVEKQTETAVTLLHRSNDETLKSYPFLYELRVTYTLAKNCVKVTYQVNNTDTKNMYFSIGSHEGYFTPEGIEDYDLIFPKKETLNAYMLDGNLLQKNTLPIIKDTNVLPLYDKYFTVDALVFKDLKSTKATLRNRKTGRQITVSFPNKPYFLLWHKPMSPYMCIEPWAGIHDPQETDYDITQKEGIIELSVGKTYKVTHTITFGD